MKQYKVLWFDDEFDVLPLILEDAAVNDITLHGFSNATDGIEELEKNYLLYEAVVVDGLFYNKRGESGDSVKDTAFFSVARAIDKLSDKKVMPWFIFSGQPGFTKEKNRYADGYKNNKVYDKTIKAHWAQLWSDLKKEADLLPETQIKHDYAKVFELCQEKYIGESALKPLMQILKSVREPNTSFDDELYFTQIRIILEYMFRAANKIGLLHDKCISGGKVNLSESSLFLAGEPTKHLNVRCKQSHFTKIISESVKSIVFVTGAASHTVDPEIKNNINLSEYRQWVNTPYLLYSLTFQLIDVLIWFKKYADENSDTVKNKSLWETLETSSSEDEWIKGQVIKIAENGYGTFKPLTGGNTLSIIPSKVSELKLYETQTIEVITKPDPTGTKKLIKSIRVL